MERVCVRVVEWSRFVPVFAREYVFFFFLFFYLYVRAREYEKNTHTPLKLPRLLEAPRYFD